MTSTPRTVKAQLASARTADTEIVNATAPVDAVNADGERIAITPAPRKGSYPLIPGTLVVPITEGVPAYVYKAGSHGAHLRILVTADALVITFVKKDGTESTDNTAISLYRGSLKASIEAGNAAVVSASKPSGGSTRSPSAVVWE